MDGGSSAVPPGLPSSRTGRVPQWVLDEAAGRQQPPDGWRAWSPAPRVPRWRARLRFLLVGVLVVGLTLGAVVVARPSLLEPLQALAGDGPHAFLTYQDDGTTPVAYDPCQPIHYVIRPNHAPDGGEEIVHEAFARVADVTGLSFVHDGRADEQATSGGGGYWLDPWAPVLVTWETPEENPDFLTEVVGQAGSEYLIIDDVMVYTSGAVSLSAPAFDRMLASDQGARRARAVVLHEIGHLVGLDHVSDRTQLMYPSTGGTLDFASGDLAGLAALGEGACLPDA